MKNRKLFFLKKELFGAWGGGEGEQKNSKVENKDHRSS